MNCRLVKLLFYSVLCTSLARRRSLDDLTDNVSCQTPNHQEGICISLNDCSQLKRKYLRQSTCGYDEFLPRVCCPLQKLTSSALSRRDLVFPEDDDSCQTPNHQEGICVSLNDCPQLRRMKNFNYLRQSICDYDGHLPLVCCPPQNVTVPATTGSDSKVIFPEDDDRCQTPNHQEGICVSLNDCPQLRRMKNLDYLRQSICDYDGHLPLVCCPPQNVTVPATTGSDSKVIFPEDDESCHTPNHQQGICISLNDCPQLKRMKDLDYLRQSNCGYDGFIPLVCCPFQNRATTRRNSEECSSFIYPQAHGLQKAELETWPWLAAIFLTENSLDKGILCTGALVTNRHIITVAHCVIDSKANSFTVHLGEYTLNNKIDGASPIDLGVESIVHHEDFERRTFKNDIAVLRLRRSVQFSRSINPVCLPYGVFQDDDLAGRNTINIGWGKRLDGRINPELTNVQTRIWKNEDCRAVLQRIVPITDEHLCAGNTTIRAPACVDESGGPLLLPSNDRKYYLVGIGSFSKTGVIPGYPCLYTRVFMYLDWLTKNLS